MAAAEQLTIIRNALASLSCQCCLRVVAIRCRAGFTKLGIEVDSGALTEAELRRGAEPSRGGDDVLAGTRCYGLDAVRMRQGARE